MNKVFLAAGMMAVGFATPFNAVAQSCPPGQIFRVSMGICQPKSSQNLQWTESSSSSRRPALRPSASEPAVGDLVLFGERRPVLLKPVVPKQVAKSPANRETANPRAKKTVVAKIPAPTKAPVVATSSSRAEIDSASRAEAAATRAPPAAPVRNLSEPTAVAVASSPRADSEAAGAASQASKERPGFDAGVARPDQNVAALEPAPTVEPPVKTHETPAAATMPPAQTTPSVAAAGGPKQVRTIPLYHSPEPEQQAAAPPGTPDWGDEKKLVEALRSNWKGTPVKRAFKLGDQVPADIPLQPLPQPFASRDTGVNMHYLMSNDDAVLVLPTLRVVVDVYRTSTASLD
jgi:hypothetical protein